MISDDVVDASRARSDVVGSLLRPPGLIEARERSSRGEISDAAFKRIEDAAVDDAVLLQASAGLDVITDGEMRRLSFQSQLTESVDGFSEWDIDAFLWGTWRSEELGDVEIERPPIAVVDTLRRKRFLSAEEFTYTRGRTDRIVKVTLPSPSLFANFWDPDRSTDAYDSAESFLGDVAEILREEVEELVRLGATYIQLDAPQYPLLIDPTYREFYERRGWPADRWIEFGTELDNHVMGEHDGVTFGFHLCRGNQMSRWLVSGGYDWLAGQLFPRIHADRLLLEYDDERSGSFDALSRRVRGHDGRPRTRHDEDRAGRDRRPAHGSHPRGFAVRAARTAGPVSPVRVRHVDPRQPDHVGAGAVEASNDLRRPRRRCGARHRDDRIRPRGAEKPSLLGQVSSCYTYTENLRSKHGSRGRTDGAADGEPWLLETCPSENESGHV